MSLTDLKLLIINILIKASTLMFILSD